MQKKINYNNQVHLHGFINDVRINPVNDEGRTAINLDVATVEFFQGKTRKTYHDAAIFTEDKDVIAKFGAIAEDCKKNIENRGVKGFQPSTHTVSLDGIFINPEDKQAYILVMGDSVKLDAKQEEKEVRNTATITGNIGSIDIHPDKKFAVISVASHYTPKGEEKESKPNWIRVNVSGNRKSVSGVYEAIEKGELQKGDFVRVGGQLHNNNFEQDGKKVYSTVLDLSRFEKIEKKEKVAEAQKAEPEKEAAEKKAAAKKAAPKKVTSKKAAGPKL